MTRDRKDGDGTCEHCRARFDYYLIHNGFSDTAYGYCDHCGMTALVGGWDDRGKPAAAPWRIQGPIQVETEPWLEPCLCGGHFRSNGCPRCPQCRESLSAAKATRWIERNAPGAKVGWRWQQTWSGIHCIVINGRSVSNNWLAEPRAVPFPPGG